MIRNALTWKNVGETSGRKQKTTEHEDRLIKRAAVTDPFVTSHHIKEDLNLSVSSRTVHRRLVQSKLVARSPRKVFFEKKACGSKIAFCKNTCRLACFKMA